MGKRRGIGGLVPWSGYRRPRVRPSRGGSAAPRLGPSSFTAELDRQAEDRHADLLSPGSGLPRQPRGFRSEDFTEDEDGFVTIAEACKIMGCDETALLHLIGTGRIEAERRGGLLLARPAIVSVSGVVVN